jgi:hypothetical protein
MGFPLFPLFLIFSFTDIGNENRSKTWSSIIDFLFNIVVFCHTPSGGG